MKECKYCGTQYADHLQSCPSCGANVVVSEKDRIIEDAHEKVEKTKMAPGKKILIAMCSIAAVLAVVIIATTVLNNRPVTVDGKTNNDLTKEYEAAMESMEVGNYEAAIAELGSSTNHCFSPFFAVIETNFACLPFSRLYFSTSALILSRACLLL